MSQQMLQQQPSARSEVMEWAKLLIGAILLALVLRSFVFTFVIVDGPSMQDLLYTDDFMLVSRLHYSLGTPQRGDVAMCHFPGSEANYVKRVIGLPGETIECRDKVTYINGQPLAEPYLTRENSWDFGPIDIPEGQYFMLGDNRLDSHDSRRVGPLPKDMLVGRAMFVIWPLNRVHMLPNQ